MGDCRIRILIAKNLHSSSSTADGADTVSDVEWHAFSHVNSADATVRDVYNAVLELLWNKETFPDDMCLWDCTLYPPKDITDYLTLFGENSGPRSKTLFDAGWFPSGTLQVLPRGQVPSTTQNYDDVQYNLPSQSSKIASSGTVRLIHHETMTPSQLLQSVTERHAETNEDEELKRALDVRRQRRQETRAKEASRHAKLEERIRKLGTSSSNKNKAVSLQVQRMLIKSRCTGSSSLKLQDRAYFHILLVQGDDNEDMKEAFRYFSRQDTVARILNSVANVSLPQEAELLIRRKANDGNEAASFRRLPVTMRLYEAMSEKLIDQVDSVVVRCFTRPQEEPTTSIDDDEGQGPDVEMEEDTSNDTPEVVGSGEPEKAPSNAVSNSNASETVNVDPDMYDRLAKAIAAMDDTFSAKGKKKKASSASAKVRAMLLKSKAKGDAKRVPKMEERFFVELVVVNDYDGECIASVSPVFLARSDPVARIVRDCVSVPCDCIATIFIPEQDSFRDLPKDISLQDAEAKGLLNNFDRAVIRLFK